MAKMLKRVQHDGRVGINGVNENIIINRHPGLVSGSLYHKVRREGTEVTEGFRLGDCSRFLMAKMLNRVSHDIFINALIFNRYLAIE